MSDSCPKCLSTRYTRCSVHIQTLLRLFVSITLSPNVLLVFYQFFLLVFVEKVKKMSPGARRPNKSTKNNPGTEFSRFWIDFGSPRGSQNRPRAPKNRSGTPPCKIIRDVFLFFLLFLILVQSAYLLAIHSVPCKSRLCCDPSSP